MEKNKTRSYLLYAFGEIALVMIGILLALQVNNWNVERTSKNAEEILLNSVIESLKEDSILLVNVQNEITEIDALYRDLYLYTEGELDSEDIVNLRYIRRSVLFNPVTMVNHPDLANDVLSRELKEAVRSYYQYMDNATFVLDTFNAHVEDIVRPHLAEINVFNYGHQYSGEDIDLFTAEDLILKEDLLNELEDPLFQQLNFETGLKYAAVQLMIEDLQIQNESMIDKLNNYLNY
jgi:hypothetical protein